MKRDLTLFLDDILESINLIEKYIKNVDFLEFSKKTNIQDSVIRRIEIIGEATKNIPQHFREKYPIVPWKEIAGMKDIITHAYFGIKLDKIWNVIKKDLPKLKKEINKVITSQSNKNI